MDLAHFYLQLLFGIAFLSFLYVLFQIFKGLFGNFFIKLWQTIAFLWRGFSYKASCKLLGHPLEWWYCCKLEDKRGYDAWCRWCASPTSKHPRLRAFTKHKGDHTYGCEIKEK